MLETWRERHKVVCVKHVREHTMGYFRAKNSTLVHFWLPLQSRGSRCMTPLWAFSVGFWNACRTPETHHHLHPCLHSVHILLLGVSFRSVSDHCNVSMVMLIMLSFVIQSRRCTSQPSVYSGYATKAMKPVVVLFSFSCFWRLSHSSGSVWRSIQHRRVHVMPMLLLLNSLTLTAAENTFPFALPFCLTLPRTHTHKHTHKPLLEGGEIGKARAPDTQADILWMRVFIRGCCVSFFIACLAARWPHRASPLSSRAAYGC